MKILYAIQGTGNGHISRAMEIVPLLKKRAEVDVLISASQWELRTNFDIQYRMKGLGFVFGKKGGVDLLRTYLRMDSSALLKEIKSLPVEKYDLVISDFEPVSAWACQLRKKACIGLSNQAVTLHPLAPRPESNDPVGKLILERYAPTTYNYGYHFRRFDETVYTPIIGKDIRQANISKKDHITVYLPSYEAERIIKKLWGYKDIQFQIFSKHSKTAYRERNFWVYPLNRQQFVNSVSGAAAIIANAGFGTSAEALFLGKPLLVIPMKTQYEQHCNAAVLQSMNVTVIPSLKKKHLHLLDAWLNKPIGIQVDYPDETDALLDKIIQRHAGQQQDHYNFDSGLKFLRRLFREKELAA
jgi:uncharacterized protein (TIGR00661 family)